MSAPFTYKTLPVKLRSGAPFAKYLYIKPHKPQTEDEAQPGATEAALFVAGIPVALNESGLEVLFGVFDEVQKVVLHPRRTSAIIVFDSALGVARALRAGTAGQALECDLDAADDDDGGAAAAGPRGLKARVEAHKARYPGTAALQRQLDEWMAAFEEEESRKRREAEAAAADDGWTVVTGRGGRKRSAGNTVSGGVAQAAAQAHLQRKKPKTADDFYRFQARERKKGELVELRRKFAEAQKQVAEMRAARKFRPD